MVSYHLVHSLYFSNSLCSPKIRALLLGEVLGKGVGAGDFILAVILECRHQHPYFIRRKTDNMSHELLPNPQPYSPYGENPIFYPTNQWPFFASMLTQSLPKSVVSLVLGPELVTLQSQFLLSLIQSLCSCSHWSLGTCRQNTTRSIMKSKWNFCCCCNNTNCSFKTRESFVIIVANTLCDL